MCLLLFLALLGACARQPIEQASLKDASGIARQGNSLLLVDDQIPSAYFRFRLGSTPPHLFLMERGSLEKITWPQAGLAIDLESIEVLADGRVVALSERLRALVDKQGLVAQYEAPLSEIGERGLEGLAVSRLDNGSSRIAVLWEGGYLEGQELSQEVRPLIGFRALRPIIQIHELEAGARGLRVPTGDGSGLIFLKVPLPPPEEPEAQRFRAPDLVWFAEGLRDKDSSTANFIVLLSSQNALPARRYANHWLQRFTSTGDTFGKPFDLDAALPEDLRGLNWEGLAWFEKGRSLVTVCETSPHGGPLAFVVPLPAEWEHDGGGLSPDR
jgi:hypothetical protein